MVRDRRARRLLTATALTAAVVPAVLGLLPVGPSSAGASAFKPTNGPASVVAMVPQPGKPEDVAVDPHDGSIWAGSNRASSAATVWHWSSTGTLLRTYTLPSPDTGYGVNGLVLDGDGDVYALTFQNSQIVKLNPGTGATAVYATFADLPLCNTGRSPCEPSTFQDRQAWPNEGVFAADGTMYVTDVNQATIWRVPKGGGAAQIWYQNPKFAASFGVNGIQLDAQGRLVFAQTVSEVADLDFGRGIVWRLPILPNGRPGALQKVGLTAISDGLAIGRSGLIYVCIVQPLGFDIQVVDPDTGNTVAQLTGSGGPVPLDDPASDAFTGTNLLVTNQSMYTLDPTHFAVLSLPVGEQGLPLNYPHL